MSKDKVFMKPTKSTKSIKSTETIKPQKQANWKFLDSIEKLEDLFQKFENYLIDGIPAKDKYGQNELVSYRVRPQMVSIHSKIMEIVPRGFFTSKSDFLRKLDAIGTECMLNLLFSRDIVELKMVDEYSGYLQKMNAISRLEQQETLEREFDDLIMRFNKGNLPRSEDIIKELKSIKENVIAFNQNRRVM